MKTLTLSAFALALATPALANPTAMAVTHFNQDLSANEQIFLPETQPVSISTRSGLKGDVVSHFNQDLSPSERISVDSVTLVSGQPTYGAEIFEAIAAEDND
ncbi:hypothetical protein [Jannaschia aquimarina]|uniref:Uncharacterized protein n=1 Tax=Jannaschia aquimarina TaxID=935700 RepID=A0A0D1CN70_9RHOB|nr:hypothetical protein [Jannaschia aquimarina]KIT16212.1 hypothetical protein jaqu_19630 [Jannaschia aquimarina]SNT17371.1 hypothetical protein SAMN05421775_1072 [Jannaschia aquimarina]